MNIAICLPAKTDLALYTQELHFAELRGESLYFKVPQFPKKAGVGDRCYIFCRGRCVGYHTITGFHEGSFDCTTTGKKWEGKFIVRKGPLQGIGRLWTLKPFRGFRYVDF